MNDIIGIIIALAIVLTALAAIITLGKMARMLNDEHDNMRGEIISVERLDYLIDTLEYECESLRTECENAENLRSCCSTIKPRKKSMNQPSRTTTTTFPYSSEMSGVEARLRKVKRQLEEELAHSETRNRNWQSYHDGYVDGFDKAISIIKSFNSNSQE